MPTTSTGEHHTKLGRWGVTVTVSLTFLLVATIVGACGDGASNGAAAGDGTVAPPLGPSACATPQMGCPCAQPGLTIPCGKTVVGEDNFKFCYEGVRTCEATGRYGDCTDGNVTTRGFTLQSGLHTRAIGANATCAGTLTDNLSICGGGKKKGEFCTTNADCGRGYQICRGSTDSTTSCKDDGDCLVTCGSFDGKCAGGTTPNVGCSVNADCAGTGATCSLAAVGPNDNCATFNGICDSSTPEDGDQCQTAADCGVGGTCTPPKFGVCLGGKKLGKKCKADKHCKGGGTCSNSPTAPIVDPCDPYCNVRIDTPAGLTLTAPFVLSPTGGLTTVAGPAPCYGTLSGRIYDPRGATPLPNIMVYLPTSALTAVPTGPACDTCSSLVSGSPSHISKTDHLGDFTMTNVPGGVAFNLVLQTGRWRKVVTLPAIACGGSAVLGAAGFGATTDNRLPRRQSATDNVPKIALTQSAGDQLECLLRKIGIDDDQFTTDAGGGRVHLYSHNGMTFPGQNAKNTLWSSVPKLQGYDFVVAPCDNNHTPSPSAGPNNTSPPAATATVAQAANMKTYVDGGGRLFTTHWISHDFVYQGWGLQSNTAVYPGGGPVEEEFGSRVDNDREPGAYPYAVDTSTPDGLLLSQWGSAPAVGAVVAGAPPRITFNSWRHLSKTVNTAQGAVRLSYGDSSVTTGSFTAHVASGTVFPGPHVNMYSFATPWPSASNTACGKVVVSQSHVSTAPGGSTSVFPGNGSSTGCANAAVAMTPQEKAFEYLFFNATACNGVTPTPVTTTPPSGVTYQVDFTATCTAGYYPSWQLFQWQAVTPAGSSIVFKASTATTIAGLATTEADPSNVPIGTANDAFSSTISGWTFDSSGSPSYTPRPVSYRLANASPVQASKLSLRVFMTFNATTTPAVLNTWRQLFDCVPAE